MQTTNSARDVFTDSRRLLKEYINARLRILKLRAVRVIAKTAGSITWVLVLLFAVFLLLVFAGLTAGFFFSSVTGSYTAGFGFTSLLILLLVGLLFALRQRLFINPVIRAIIQAMDEKNNKDIEN